MAGRRGGGNGTVIRARSHSGRARPQPRRGPARVRSCGTYCPWKYILTDGKVNNVRVYDDPQRGSIIAAYAPNQVFYAADPPQIVNKMMKTEHGWIGMGNWVQRFAGATMPDETVDAVDVWDGDPMPPSSIRTGFVGAIDS